MDLARRGILKQLNCELIGAKEEVIAKAEGREQFKQAMLKIGLDVAKSGVAHTVAETREIAAQAGSFPVLIRHVYPHARQDGWDA